MSDERKCDQPVVNPQLEGLAEELDEIDKMVRKEEEKLKGTVHFSIDDTRRWGPFEYPKTDEEEVNG